MTDPPPCLTVKNVVEISFYEIRHNNFISITTLLIEDKWLYPKGKVKHTYSIWIYSGQQSVWSGRAEFYTPCNIKAWEMIQLTGSEISHHFGSVASCVWNKTASRVAVKARFWSLLRKGCIHVSFMQVSRCSALKAPDGGVTAWGCQNTLLQLCQAGNSQVEAA